MTRTTDRSSKSPPTSPPTWDEWLIRRLLPLRTELVGLVLIAIAFLVLGGLLTPNRPGWVNLIHQVSGWGAYPLTFSLGVAGLHLLIRRLRRPIPLKVSQVIGFELVILTALPLTYAWSGADLPAALQGQGGGLIGWALADPLLTFLGPFLTSLLYGALLLWGLALIVQVGWEDGQKLLIRLSDRLQRAAVRLEPDEMPPRPRPVPEPAARPEAPLISDMLMMDNQEPAFAPLLERDPHLPPLDVLATGEIVPMSEAEVEAKSDIIEKTLRDFHLRGRVVEVRRGPAVTQFGLEPGYLERTGPDGQPRQYKVRVSQIAALRKDLALALQVPRLRIQAPVPGRGIVGIEIPNTETSLVRLRPVLESPIFAGLQAPLAVGLGLGVSGAPLAINLAKMPHLLIAGTTGSGKSVCLNAFIACLVFNNTPEQLRLVMIDPKRVELIRFNGLPHILGQVEVEHDRVIGVISWLMAEMDRRYEVFALAGARNLDAYNRKMRRRRDGKSMPHIVIIIDEMADLMAMYPADVERGLCRLAQMARATGMHMVVATQRPSTDVITGLIKANFPARISFAVASSIDSRVILDTVGAEQLLGRGDMLYLSPEASAPLRVQGCFVSEQEINQLVAHWLRHIPEGFEAEAEAPWESLIARQNYIEQTDDMLEEAIALAQEYDTLSTSFLQRRLRVGYPRAARLMEALYNMDLVEDPQDGGQTRRSYVNEDEDDPLARFLSEHEEDGEG